MCAPLRGGGLFLLVSLAALAAPQLGPWRPLFQGIDHLVATNSASSTDFDNLMVANALRVDLQDPDVRLFSTPRIDNYQANGRETAGRTVSRFLQNYHLQVAINANFFDPTGYYLPEGTPMIVRGLAISDGLQVSARTDASPTLLVDALNHAEIIANNEPAADTTGIHTAITGDYPLVVQGVNIGRKYLNVGGFIHEANPRTAVGLSQDRRYLYLLTIDGRQPGYSHGAYDYETGAWLKLLGAHDALNLDGGGSTTMSWQNSLGNPERLNKSSAVADSGKERTVGAHFGVFAKPLVGFVNTVLVQPDDTSAVVTWNTPTPATSQVEYGLTGDYGQSSVLQTLAITNHSVQLTGLKPDTGYFFRAISTVDANRYTSADLFFTTTNYVIRQVLVETTANWKYTHESLDGTEWTAPPADEAAWSGPGAGLLWVDARSTGPNEAVQPKGQELPGDPGNSGLPFLTYYFRTHFAFTGKAPNIVLHASAFVDDGAVFYLNGHEIYRLRMEDAPAPIANDSLAAGFPCEGDATCADEFSVGEALADFLINGDNVLAVEVHNYNARSADITFGLQLTAAVPRSAPAVLGISAAAGALSLNWTASGYVLQEAGSPDGPWLTVPGPITSGPYTPPGNQTTHYYRLKH